MAIRNDGRASLDELRAHYRASRAVQAHRKVLEDDPERKMLAYTSQDLFDLRSSWYVAEACIPSAVFLTRRWYNPML